ncbi:TPA: hypothetical protein ACH3X1_015610 [Trebouxia sp. C0004]
MVHLQSQFVNMNQASLALQVLSLAIIATLAAFMVITIIKHRHYFYEQQPQSHGKASAEGLTGPIPQRLTLLQLLTVTDTDDLDAMAANFVRAATDDYLHDLLRRARIGHLRLKGRPGTTASESGPWSGRNSKTNSPKVFWHRSMSCCFVKPHQAREEEVEDRLHGNFIHVSSLEDKAARAKQLHAAELSDVISNLELSQQSLKSFCDSQTHKLNESYADLHISDHLRNSSEQRLEGVTAQHDRLADQVDSLRNGNYAQDRELLQVRAQNTQRASELTVALTKKANGRKQLQQLQRGNDDLSAQLAATLSGKAAAEQHAQQLQAELTAVSAGKQGSERQLALLGNRNEELQHQLTAASKEAAQHATHIGRSLVAKARLQSRLDSSLEHLRLSRAELDVMSAQTQARFEREAEQHAEVVQQLQQQRDREARAHKGGVCGEQLASSEYDMSNLCLVLSSSNGVALFESESIALLGPAFRQRARLVSLCRLEQRCLTSSLPSNKAANIPTPKHAPVGAGKAVPAFPSPSAKGIVSSGQATPANAYIPGKGAPSAQRPCSTPCSWKQQGHDGNNSCVCRLFCQLFPRALLKTKLSPASQVPPSMVQTDRWEAGPKPGLTPLQDLSNGTKPARSSASQGLQSPEGLRQEQPCS